MADGTKEGLIKLGGSTKDLAIKMGDGTKDLAVKTGVSLAKAGDTGSTLCVGPSRRVASQVRAICCKPTRLPSNSESSRQPAPLT